MKLLIIYILELVLSKSIPTEQRIMICFDLSGFKLSCMDYDIVKLLISILEFNYPETLSSALIINAPFIFYACWAVIRPWLDPITASKVAFIKQKDLINYLGNNYLIDNHIDSNSNKDNYTKTSISNTTTTTNDLIFTEKDSINSCDNFSEDRVEIPNIMNTTTTITTSSSTDNFINMFKHPVNETF